MGLNREGTTQSGGGGGLSEGSVLEGMAYLVKWRRFRGGGGRTILVKWRTLLREGLIKGNVS